MGLIPLLLVVFPRASMAVRSTLFNQTMPLHVGDQLRVRHNFGERLSQFRREMLIWRRQEIVLRISAAIIPVCFFSSSFRILPFSKKTGFFAKFRLLNHSRIAVEGFGPRDGAAAHSLHLGPGQVRTDRQYGRDERRG